MALLWYMKALEDGSTSCGFMFSCQHFAFLVSMKSIIFATAAEQFTMELNM